MCLCVCPTVVFHVCVVSSGVYVCVVGLCSQQRSYHSGHARSLQHSDAKLGRAELVLRWGTTRESSVLLFFLSMSLPDEGGLACCGPWTVLPEGPLPRGSGVLGGPQAASDCWKAVILQR